MTPWLSDPDVTLYHGDARGVLRGLADGSVDCVVTSPPYWGLRDYGTDGQIGLEATPDEFVAGIVAVFREVRRVLAPHGTCWVNLGDSYGTGSLGRNDADRNFTGGGGNKLGSGNPGQQGAVDIATGLKPKDLVGIPWRVAFALQADGWYLRSDIIWAKPNPMPESVTDRPTKSHEYVFLLTKRPRYFFDAEAVREPATEGTDLGLLRGRSRDATGKVAWAAPSIARRQEAGVDSRNGNPSGRRNIRSVWNIATQPYPEAHFATFPEELARRCILAGCPVRVCRVCGKPSERIVRAERTNHRPTTYAVDAANGAMTGGTDRNFPDTIRRDLGWSDCGHNNWRPDDHEIIQSPLGERVGDDPSMTTGRAGMNRPRHPDEGRRPMTRYQQRMYADQLRASEHRQEMTDEAGGASTFAHYIRTDRSGARPVPAALLEAWIGRGWLTTVEPPEVEPHNNWRPGVVLDPFIGSGTTAKVARDHARHAVGIDLSERYLELAARRLQQLSLLTETAP